MKVWQKRKDWEERKREKGFGSSGGRSISPYEAANLLSVGDTATGGLAQEGKDRLIRVCRSGNRRRFERVQEEFRNGAYEPIVKAWVFDLPGTSQMPAGGLDVGEILRGQDSPVFGRYILRPDDLRQGCGMFASNGMGKTWLACGLLSQGVLPFLVFDRKKNFRVLLNGFEPGVLAVFRDALNRDRFNPLQCECHPEEHIRKLANELSQWQWLMAGGTKIVVDMVRWAYRARGVYDGSKNYPDVLFMEKLAAKWKSKQSGFRESAWKESVLRAFQTIASWPVFHCKMGYDQRPFLQGMSAVFEVSTEDDWVANLYQNLKLHLWRDLKQSLGVKTLQLIVFEEAHRLFPPQIARFWQNPTPYKIFREIRAENFCVMVIDQVHSEMPSVVLQNLNTNFYLRMGGRSAYSVAQHTSMNREQIAMLTKLPFRNVIVSSVSVPEPCLVKIPELHFSDVLDSEVDDVMGPVLSRMNYVPIVDQISLSAELFEEKAEEVEGVNIETGPDETNRINAILKDIGEFPFEGRNERVSRLEKEAGVRGAEFDRQVQKLIDWGFVEEVKIPGERRPKKGLVLTRKGAEHAGGKVLPGKHNEIGNFYLHWVTRAEFPVNIEDNGNDAVVYHSDGTFTVYEWESQPSNPHVKENLARALNSGASKIIFAVHGEKEKEQLIRNLDGYDGRDLGKVEVKTLRDFI